MQSVKVKRGQRGSVEVSWNGGTVWVNDKEGACLGRFSRSGVDVHRDLKGQQEVGLQCLVCSHGIPGPDGWGLFVKAMIEHHGVVVPLEACPHWVTGVPPPGMHPLIEGASMAGGGGFVSDGTTNWAPTMQAAPEKCAVYVDGVRDAGVTVDTRGDFVLSETPRPGAVVVWIPLESATFIDEAEPGPARDAAFKSLAKRMRGPRGH